MYILDLTYLMYHSVIAMLVVRFWWQSVFMWADTKFIALFTKLNIFAKVLSCEWCFSFWASVIYAVVFISLGSGLMLGLLPFIVPPLNMMINAVVDRY